MTRRARLGLQALLGLLLCAALVLTAVTARDAPIDALLLPMPWWVLAVLFGVTEWSATPVRRGSRVYGLSFGALPLTFGLLLTEPRQLLAGALVGFTAARVLHRGAGPLPDAWAVGIQLGQVALAVQVTGLILRGTPPADTARLVTGLVVTGVVAVGAVLVRLARIVLSRPGARRGRPVLAELVVAGVMAALIAATAAAVTLGFEYAEGALPFAAVSCGALIGLRAFEALGRRRRALERLYLFSDALAATPTPVEVVRMVLEQSLGLLQVGYAEIVVEGGPDTPPVAWTARVGQAMAGPVAGGSLAAGLTSSGPAHLRLTTAAHRALLHLRGVREAVVAPLGTGGRPAGRDLALDGHILVADRRGEQRGFSDGDLRLLVTVANHARVALSHARLIERLNVEAHYDELTGLPNRTAFRRLLEGECEALGDHDGSFAVMLLDFDGFKAINDTLGHSAGDEVLRVLGGRLAAAVSGIGSVARLGGDEFAVIVPGVRDRRDAQVLAARVLASFDDPVPVGDARLRLGGSLGVAVAPEHGTDASDLMRAADVAMYAAKSGAGGARLFTPDLLELDTLSLTLGGDLRDAISRGEIDIVVHPLLHLATEELHSVEVLARWNHAELGRVEPETFFAAAEQAGLVPALSAGILDRALAQCRAWLDGGTTVRVAVNLAPRWLADLDLPVAVHDALERHGVPAHLLSLELTERSVIADPQRVTLTLERLRGLGVHLSVDDFGTGYSSLTYLSRLPVDQLKIDKLFVERIAQSDRDRAIVQSLVDLGRHLGLEVVAEGVSTPAVRDVLEEIGCPLAQGYLFTTPFPPSGLEEFVAAPRVGHAADGRVHQLDGA